MVKVAFDAERMKYNHTGLFHYCSLLGHNLVNEINETHAAVDISFYLPATAQGHFGKNVQYLLQKPLHKFYMPFAAAYDVWHSTFQGTSYFPFSARAKKILTIHDLNFLYEKNNKGKQKKYLAQLQKKIEYADTVTAISNFVKQEVIEHVNLKGKEVTVIYNGCNIKAGAAITPPATIPPAPFIFSIGTIARKKNFHVLPSLLLHNDYYLVIAGITQDSGYKEEIIATAKKLGVANRLILTGSVQEEEKYWYLQNCLAFAFPSVAEGFGLPVIEAMHFGKPTFLSKATSLPEIGGNAAFYFDNFEPAEMNAIFNNGMLHYKNNPDFKDKIKSHSLQFNWAQTARQYIACYLQTAKL